ncbi:DUF3592 domain-containing protein [Umezawaea endophytica]|uniref:DUF3592 domain-containing protein n=1 Tax=Umezawaea endophytica TaxID=1654476 RepID=A0A9X2VXF3_9PSEU|nr:DUF3592 domain-containing protein [Umezawaea endophytica]MCS7484361.1 hypothetical protein [Umezawaea endophytica]
MVDDAVQTSQRAPAGVRVRRGVARALLVVGGVVTLVAALLMIAAWRDDQAIEANLGNATAEVVSVAFNRTVIRFGTPDGKVQSPSQGVLYPEGLEVGQLVRIEYDTTNTELARIWGRGASLAVLPISTFLLVVWALLLPAIWFTRRGLRRL